MKVKKYVVAAMLTLLCVLCLPQTTKAATEGYCGDDCTWICEDGVLTISGKGEITDNPWMENYKESIKKVVINEGITSIKVGWAFENCKQIEEVSFPDSLEYIASFAFRRCTALEEVTIPKNLKESGTSCFEESGLTTLTFADGVEEVPIDMFEKSRNLKNIYFPQSLKKINVGAFGNCTALEEVTCPWYLEEIETWAFRGCTSLKKVTIYQNVKQISEYAFRNNDYKYLTGITFYGKRKTEVQNFAAKYGYEFKTCKVPALKGITYAKNGLDYKVVKDYVDGKGTVYVTGLNKNLSSVVIPKTVKLESYDYKVVGITSKAFYKKANVKKVTIKSTVITKIGKNAFKGIDKKATITVPKKNYTVYKILLKNAGVKSPMKIKKK